ncbi:MAG TPA: DUF1697 domain-containing protein [Flavobacterium sp.]|jgi:uncharacterized protein (DUF1697 family)|nr:DUF1697 domain-containing protein [Flavobacterium sp.]
MNTYIALLRGINVSGHKMISMPALREALAELPVSGISTYIQSGNVIFKSELSEKEQLAKLISAKILEKFAYEVPVIVVTPADLVHVLNNNPFPLETLQDGKQPYVNFASSEPAHHDIEILKTIDFGADRFAIIEKAIYVYYADSAGKTKLTTAVLEKKLEIVATARNWKTVNKLLELSSRG